ncbi:MAG: hypothetical protein E2O88_03200 [Bacteroidetes bacterium]|nr:MAG: hypothetical protein E2O88_03200 [Bacteroidota bacterium]
MELSKEYIKGFNNGYLLRKHQPMIMKNLEQGIKGDSPYVQGLKDGNVEYELELNRKLELHQQKSKNKSMDKDCGLGL